MFSFTDTFLQGQGDAADNPPANPFFSPFGLDDYPELLRAIRLLPTDAINAPTIPSSSSPLPEPPDHDKGTAAQELPKVMASSAGGGRRAARKDRHSKIVTAKGPRDRRMRLSLDVAKKFFDLQDALHFDKPSETVEWLLNKSKYAIRSLGSRSRSDQEGSSCNDANTEPPTSSSECGEVDSQTMIGKDASRTIDEIDPGPVVGIEEQTNEGAQNLPKARWQTPRKTMLLHPTSIAKESRAKARARARERTMEKKILKQLGSPTGSSSDMQKMNSSQLGALDYFQ